MSDTINSARVVHVDHLERSRQHLTDFLAPLGSRMIRIRLGEEDRAAVDVAAAVLMKILSDDNDLDRVYDRLQSLSYRLRLMLAHPGQPADPDHPTGPTTDDELMAWVESVGAGVGCSPGGAPEWLVSVYNPLTEQWRYSTGKTAREAITVAMGRGVPGVPNPEAASSR